MQTGLRSSEGDNFEADGRFASKNCVRYRSQLLMDDKTR